MQILNTVVPQFAKALEQKGEVMEKIETVVKTYIRILTEHPDIPFFIMSELSQKRESFIAELKTKPNTFLPCLLF